MAVLLGGIGVASEKLSKSEKIDMLENYYQAKLVGYSDKDALIFVLDKYRFYPNIYDRKKELFLKLLSKNNEIIKDLLKIEKSRFFEKFMKL